MNYHNKTAVITGASSGLGVAFANQLHSAGANVILVARREDRLQKAVDDFNRTRENSARHVACDLASSDIERVISLLTDERVDILVSNAGRGSFGRFENLRIDQELQMVQLNLVAPMQLMHAVIPQMKLRREGIIISVASIAAFQPLPFMSTYSATKSFNLNHAVALRHELKEFGIRVVALCPGPTATEYADSAGIPPAWQGIYHDQAESVVRGAFRALESGWSWITPGVRSRFVVALSHLLPLEITTMITKRLLNGAAVSLDRK